VYVYVSSPGTVRMQAAAAPEGAGAALEERGRVRDLLKAAQDGDLAAFKVEPVHKGVSSCSATGGFAAAVFWPAGTTTSTAMPTGQSIQAKK
jgi:hypothetical protein